VVLIAVGLLLFSGQFQQMARLGSFFDYYNELALGRFLFIIFVGLMVVGLLPAYLAYRKGRSFFTWWVFGATLFPIALPLALRLSSEEAQEDAAPQEAGSSESIPAARQG
jgi:hypothetical protein